MKCPNCGAKEEWQFAGGTSVFECFTTVRPGYAPDRFQTQACVRNQLQAKKSERDALKARVNELEGWIASLHEAKCVTIEKCEPCFTLGTGSFVVDQIHPTENLYLGGPKP